MEIILKLKLKKMKKYTKVIPKFSSSLYFFKIQIREAIRKEQVKGIIGERS